MDKENFRVKTSNTRSQKSETAFYEIDHKHKTNNKLNTGGANQHRLEIRARGLRSGVDFMRR